MVTNGLATNHTLVCVVMLQWNQWQLVVVTVIVVMGMANLLMALKPQQGLWTSQRQELSTLHVTQILRKNQKQTSNLLLFSVRVTMLSMTKFWLRIITNGFLTLVMTMFAIMQMLRLWHLLKLKHQLLNQQRLIKQNQKLLVLKSFQQVVLIMWHVAWMLKTNLRLLQIHFTPWKKATKWTMTRYWLRITTNGFLTLVTVVHVVMWILRLWKRLSLNRWLLKMGLNLLQNLNLRQRKLLIIQKWQKYLKSQTKGLITLRKLLMWNLNLKFPLRLNLLSKMVIPCHMIRLCWQMVTNGFLTRVLVVLVAMLILLK